MKRLLLVVALLGPAAWGSETAPAVLTSSGTSVSQAFNPGQQVLIQCDAAAYYLWGSSTVVVSSSNGVKVAADEKIDTRAGVTARYLAVISVTGTANCKAFPVWGAK